MKKRIIISNTFDPAYNLALEEYLIECKRDVLYLWQNANTIVIGRNQNPYKECNLRKMNEDGVTLIRRKSGGGAVFHDLGNLNFTIISPKKEDNIENNFNLVNNALKTLKITSVFNGRNDLLVDGKKISGNAFYEKDSIFCHHGTLLIDVDMDRLGNYLTASKLKLESNGIDSVKSRVVNLNDIIKNISVDSVKKALIKEYILNNDDIEAEFYSKDDIESNNEIMKRVNRYKSWEWVYGESPSSNITYEEKFDFGIVSLELEVVSGVIKQAKVYTDSIINDDFLKIGDYLKEKEFKKVHIIHAIINSIKSEVIRDSLVKRFKKI